MPKPILTKERIVSLRADILKNLDDKNHIRRGAGEGLAKKYGIAVGSLGYHRERALKEAKRSKQAKSIAPAPRRATREEFDVEAFNADIESGEYTDEELKRKHGLSNGRFYSFKKKTDTTPPLTPEQCERFVAALGKITTKRPDIITHLAKRVGAKFPDIWMELI